MYRMHCVAFSLSSCLYTYKKLKEKCARNLNLILNIYARVYITKKERERKVDIACKGRVIIITELLLLFLN